jgi:hypothetical protein
VELPLGINVESVIPGRFRSPIHQVFSFPGMPVRLAMESVFGFPRNP